MSGPGTNLGRSRRSGASASVLTALAFAFACPARATWRPLDPGFIPESLVAAPTNPQRLVASTSWGATATSLDGGQTWLAGLPVLAGSGSFVFDGVDENTLYRTDWAGLWRSVDGGATWELRCGPILSFSMASLHNDPAAPSELFLTVDGDANYRSADGGATWTRVSGFAGWVFTVPGCASLFSASIDNTLRESIDVYRSSDGGRTWRPDLRGIPGTDQGPAFFYRPQTAPLPYLKTSTAAWAVVRETGFHPLYPCRLVDTRTAGAPLSPSAPRRVPVTGVCGVPDDAVSVAANLTIVDATAAGELAVSGDDPVPNGSGTVGMPFLAARARATGIVPELGPTGDLGLATIEPFSGSVHVVVDVSGYFR